LLYRLGTPSLRHSPKARPRWATSGLPNLLVSTRFLRARPALLLLANHSPPRAASLCRDAGAFYHQPSQTAYTYTDTLLTCRVTKAGRGPDLWGTFPPQWPSEQRGFESFHVLRDSYSLVGGNEGDREPIGHGC